MIKPKAGILSTLRRLLSAIFKPDDPEAKAACERAAEREERWYGKH